MFDVKTIQSLWTRQMKTQQYCQFQKVPKIGSGFRLRQPHRVDQTCSTFFRLRCYSHALAFASRCNKHVVHITSHVVNAFSCYFIFLPTLHSLWRPLRVLIAASALTRALEPALFGCHLSFCRTQPSKEDGLVNPRCCLKKKE